jgi:hypothetical protein
LRFAPKVSGKVGACFTPVPAPILSKVPNGTKGTICAQAFLNLRSTMTLKMFLDDKSFHCLKRAIPAGSRAKLVIEEAVNLKFFGSKRRYHLQ